MRHDLTETIVAIATPPGRGGIGIVRISGAKASDIAEHLLGRLPEPRYAHRSRFVEADGAIIDAGIALWFPGPNSFTGEDVLEIQGHGSPVVLDRLVQRVVELGARIARPGEFSERAFLNNKIDLTQAEAIASLIESTTLHSAKAALRSLQGEFSKQINALADSLVELRMYVEAALDFPEEEIDFLADQQVMSRLSHALAHLEQILANATQGCLLQEGCHIAILGKPNAGKSSLLNRLSGMDTAIVTDIPGTTRDVLRESVQLNGLTFHLSDTAGLRDSTDIIEQEGIKRAQHEAIKASHVLWVVDGGTLAHFPQSLSEIAEHSDWLPKCPVTIIVNKIDLATHQPQIQQIEGHTLIALSAKTGIGMELLHRHLQTIAGQTSSSEGIFLARRRHVDALQRAKTALSQGIEQLQTYKAGELLAEDLRQTHQELAEITGEFTTDDLLGKIFSSFCVGK